MTRKVATSTPQLDLIPIADVDLIRFERNLLRIGFFGAQEDRKGTPPYIRRIEAAFNRDGQRITAAIEFEGTRGLPSTADRDKYMAFMKIADEQRLRYGHITNPIRFTGYRLLQELGICDSGANYEDINSWGERMTNTTITSRQVVFFARTKRYANKTLHVFESFQRVGKQSSGKQSGNSRSEEFEVVLSDWLLDNLNTNYAIPENFTAYKQLKRATAKGIFPPLHWWFSSNAGRVFEKDYKELCTLLGIQSYTFLSEIKRTMGKALDELIELRYLSRWDIQPMAAKEGYKIILWPGEDLIRSLDQAGPKLPSTTQTSRLIDNISEQSANAEPNQELTMEAQQALAELLRLGIGPAKAQALTTQHSPATILDVTEYVTSLVHADKNKRIQNPAGLLIYYLHNDMPIPGAFLTTRKRRNSEAARHLEAQERQRQLDLDLAFDTWRAEQVDAELVARFPGSALAKKIAEVVGQRSKTDNYFKRVSPTQREGLARQILAKEIREQMALPSFEDWCKTHAQYDLFEQ